MNPTAIAYQHFTLEQWKIIVKALDKQTWVNNISVKEYDDIVAILNLCPSAAL